MEKISVQKYVFYILSCMKKYVEKIFPQYLPCWPPSFGVGVINEEADI